jgi:hypothetical protein
MKLFIRSRTIHWKTFEKIELFFFSFCFSLESVNYCNNKVIIIINKMCKFNNHLFTFSILINVLLIGTVQSASLGEYFEELLKQVVAPENDYDIIYDQRQNGSENYRLSIDGVFVGVPSELDDTETLSQSDLPFILSGLGLDSDTLTDEEQDLYSLLLDLDFKSKHTTTKDNLLIDNLPTKTDASDSEDAIVPAKDGELRSPERMRLAELLKGKMVGKKVGKKSFRSQLSSLLRPFLQRKNLN